MKKVSKFFFGSDPVTTVVGYMFAAVVAIQATRTIPHPTVWDYILAVAIALLGRASGDAREYIPSGKTPAKAPVDTTVKDAPQDIFPDKLPEPEKSDDYGQ